MKGSAAMSYLKNWPRESRLASAKGKADLEQSRRRRKKASGVEVNSRAPGRRREDGKKKRRKPQIPVPEQAQPTPGATQLSPIRKPIMPDGANKGSFVQDITRRIAVDAQTQIIVAADLTIETNDKQQTVADAGRK